ncbi:MAG TPA: MYXO-CTERM sorting domain-containing protein [Polyangia bacterium]
MQAQRLTVASLVITSLDPAAPGGFTLATGGAEPAVAASGTSYLVAWRTGTDDVAAVHVRPATGALVDAAPLTVAGTADHEYGAAVSWDGAQYLVSWTSHPQLSPALATHVRLLPEAAGLGVGTVTDLGIPGQALAAAFDGTYHVLPLLVDGIGGPEVHAVRVSTAGALVDDFVVAPSDVGAPAVARGPGQQLLIAYHAFIDRAPYGPTRHVFGRLVVPCASAAECDDGDPCTVDSCDVAAGGCRHVTYACTPGECEASAVCDGSGGCLTTAQSDGVACADEGLTCTTDACQAGACRHAVQDGWCAISGQCVTAGTVDPADGCRRCDPAASTGAWSPVVGCFDAGAPDAGPTDAPPASDDAPPAASDAPPAPDAPPDAPPAPTDAPPTPTDGSLPPADGPVGAADGGASPDAGAGGTAGGGCGCRAGADAGSPGLVLAAVALALALVGARRRRSRRPCGQRTR